MTPSRTLVVLLSGLVVISAPAIARATEPITPLPPTPAPGSPLQTSPQPTAPAAQQTDPDDPARARRRSRSVPDPQELDDDDPERFAHWSRPPPGPPEPSEPFTAQLWVGILSSVFGLAVVGSVAGIRGNGWYALAALGGWSIGTGLIVCAIGQGSPTRHGGCGASVLGALVGALAILPGVWLLARPHTCTTTGPNADDACAVSGFVDGAGDLLVLSTGYILGTSFGARAGWSFGASYRAPSALPTAFVPVFSLRF